MIMASKGVEAKDDKSFVIEQPQFFSGLLVFVQQVAKSRDRVPPLTERVPSMSSFSRRIIKSAPVACSMAIVALVSGAVLTAGPMTAVAAETAPHPATQLPQTTPPQAGVEPSDAQTETVEQRIANLRTALKITSEEDVKWTAVAQAMRENAAAMQKLVDERSAQDKKNTTAVQDLKSYEKFTQAHADGLKNLMSSFEALYNSMPEAQKKLADQVFENFGRKGARSHG